MQKVSSSAVADKLSGPALALAFAVALVLTPDWAAVTAFILAADAV